MNDLRQTGAAAPLAIGELYTLHVVSFSYILQYIRIHLCQGPNRECEFAAKDLEESNSMRWWNLAYRKISDAESLQFGCA